MRKTKYFIVFLVTLGVFTLTSCVDYVQAISYDGENYNGYCRVALSKMFLDNEGEESSDLSIDEDVLNSLPKGVSVKDFETELEEGLEITFSKKESELTQELISLIPFYESSTNRYFIPFPLGKEIQEDGELETPLNSGNEEDETGKAIANMMMSNVKCRIMVDKNIIPSIEKAYFQGIEEDIYPLSFYDYGNGYCIEVPLLLFSAPLPYNFSHIITQ